MSSTIHGVASLVNHSSSTYLVSSERPSIHSSSASAVRSVMPTANYLVFRASGLASTNDAIFHPQSWSISQQKHRTYTPSEFARPDLNRRKTCSLRCARLPGFEPSLLTRPLRFLVCAGPDLNRRTPTGQRPKRCAFGLARQPAPVSPYPCPAKIAIAIEPGRVPLSRSGGEAPRRFRAPSDGTVSRSFTGNRRTPRSVSSPPKALLSEASIRIHGTSAKPTFRPR